MVTQHCHPLVCPGQAAASHCGCFSRDAPWRPRGRSSSRGHHPRGTGDDVPVLGADAHDSTPGPDHPFRFALVWTPLPLISWLCPVIGHIGIADAHGKISDFAGSQYVSYDNMMLGPPARYVPLSVDRISTYFCQECDGVRLPEDLATVVEAMAGDRQDHQGKPVPAPAPAPALAHLQQQPPPGALAVTAALMAPGPMAPSSDLPLDSGWLIDLIGNYSIARANREFSRLTHRLWRQNCHSHVAVALNVLGIRVPCRVARFFSRIASCFSGGRSLPRSSPVVGAANEDGRPPVHVADLRRETGCRLCRCPPVGGPSATPPLPPSGGAPLTAMGSCHVPGLRNPTAWQSVGPSYPPLGSRWNQVWLALFIFFSGRYDGVNGVVRTWAPFVSICTIITVMAVLL
ncbi:hypothetical protein H696_04360 [Fonticula alba]|uniref:Uncharacterized protein n=1 Tax=Fonticula alba TaxID=691883 RepID=A0A058Z491_FONAL|nr:hypothetical protein H696_04360 [Fonticula alba]KCV68941.1 hypothetical protein H696_04360 [Fonticula alba]|eukprot:XP_009496512.1 hypothetical protein H696_04360 [Fonticula alba]